MQIAVTREVLELLRSEARFAMPSECCGVLLGTKAAIMAILPARNVHAQPRTCFEIDPQTLIDAHRAGRAGGPQVLGYYHSHPHGPAHPSQTDRAQAAHDGSIWAIVAPGGDISFWQDDQSGFTALPYAVDDG